MLLANLSLLRPSFEPGTRTAFCAGCLATERVDQHWRTLRVDGQGNLLSSFPERDCDLAYERPGTVLACGQGSALRVYERYLHTGQLMPLLWDVTWTPEALDLYTDRLFDPTQL